MIDLQQIEELAKATRRSRSQRRPAMSNYLSIIKPGSPVESGGVSMVVHEVLIELDCVKYKCGWWAGNEHKTDWFPKFALTAEPDSHTRVGFR